MRVIGSRKNSIALTCTKNSLDAEPILCTENTHKNEVESDAHPLLSSSIFHSSRSDSLPGFKKFRRQRTSHVSTSSAQSASRRHVLCWHSATRSCFYQHVKDSEECQPSYEPRFHVQSRDSPVQRSISHPMGQVPSGLATSTMYTWCPGPASISDCARRIRFGTTSFSSSYHQPTGYRRGTIEDLCRVLRHCL